MSRTTLSVLWLSALPVPSALIELNTDSPVVVVTDRQDVVEAAAMAGLPCIGIEKGAERLSAPYIFESETDIDKEALERVYRRFYQLPLTIAETNRLRIRELTEADFDFVRALAKHDPDSADEPLTIEKLSSQIKAAYPFYEFGIWLIELTAGQTEGNPKPIGILSFSHEDIPALGYHLIPEARHQGLATEAAAAGLAYMREIGYEEFVCRIAADNTASQRVAEKLGFSRGTDYNWNWTSQTQSFYNKDDM